LEVINTLEFFLTSLRIAIELRCVTHLYVLIYKQQFSNKQHS